MKLHLRNVCNGFLCASILLIVTHTATTQAIENRSKLLATGAVTTIEGAAGGGIVPMAVISGYGAQEEYSATAFASYVNTSDYSLKTLGASVSWHNRIEISYAEQTLTHQSLTDALTLPDNRIQQSIIGAKIRLAGDLIYTTLPQISAGIQYKKNNDFFVPSAVGARESSGTDIYLSATKLMLDSVLNRNLLLNATLRYTNANEQGLVGFGGDTNDQKEIMSEVSAGLFLNRHWLVGGEYRQKPNNLSAIKEDDWATCFISWFPNKSIALVAAYVDLGEVATFKNQRGGYISLQGSF